MTMKPEIYTDTHGSMIIKTDIEGAAEILRGLCPKRVRLTDEERARRMDELLGPDFRNQLQAQMKRSTLSLRKY